MAEQESGTSIALLKSESAVLGGTMFRSFRSFIQILFFIALALNIGCSGYGSQTNNLNQETEGNTTTTTTTTSSTTSTTTSSTSSTTTSSTSSTTTSSTSSTTSTTVTTTTTTSSTTLAPPAPSDDLVTIDQFEYQGAFRFDGNAGYGNSDLNWSDAVFTVDIQKNSLFITSHVYQNAIGEFLIPPLKSSGTVSSLNIAQNLQPFSRNFMNAIPNPEDHDKYTGMLLVNGQLLVNSEKWYDAAGSNRDTTLVIRNPENLAGSQVSGYYEMEGAAHAGGYMAPIPSEWQSSFGATHLTGWSSVWSIIGRYSVGPSLFSFNPLDLLSGSGGTIATATFMDYSLQNPIEPNFDLYNYGPNGFAPALWNMMSSATYGFIIPGTRTFMAIGSNAGIQGGIGYKITQDNGNVCGGACPYFNNEVYNYYWLFDIDEILSANNVYDPQPYAHGVWSLPYDNSGFHSIGSGFYDLASDLLYISLPGAGQVGQFDNPPVIVVFKLNRN